jgi:hypothetical protein
MYSACRPCLHQHHSHSFQHMLQHPDVVKLRPLLHPPAIALFDKCVHRRMPGSIWLDSDAQACILGLVCREAVTESKASERLPTCSSAKRSAMMLFPATSLEREAVSSRTTRIKFSHSCACGKGTQVVKIQDAYGPSSLHFAGI